MAYQRILAAVDLTDEASEVVAAAQRQAGYTNAELHLVNVIKPVTHTYAGLDMNASGIVASLDQQLLDQAKEEIHKLANEAGISAERVHIKNGSPAAEIRATAEAIEADLIIMGTHGQHGLGLLLGSTANGVLHGVQCDVLTIRIHT